MNVHDKIVAGAAVRGIFFRDLDKALSESLKANGVKAISNEGLERVCSDIGRAVEKQTWRPQQLFIEGRD